MSESLKESIDPGAESPNKRTKNQKTEKSSSRKRLRALLAVVTALAIAGCAAFGTYKAFYDPYRHQVPYFEMTKPTDTVLTQEQITEDMQYVYDRVSERHPAWLDGSTDLTEAFDRSYKEQCEYLASIEDGATVEDEWLAIARVLASLGDAHTMCNISTENEPHLEKVRGDELSDEAVLVNVGGRSVDTLFESFKTVCSYESELWAVKSFEDAIVRKPWLDAFEIDTSGDVVFEYADGKTIKQVVYRFTNEPAAEMDSGEKTTEQSESTVSYIIDSEHSIGLLDINECVYDDEYCAVLDRFFAEVAEQGIENVAVDLRDNPGGNSQVANEFIEHLDVQSYIPNGENKVRFGNRLITHQPNEVTVVPKPDSFGGDVYVLTSPGSFSSAVLFAEMIQDNGLGKVIGEQPGGMPSAYGDIVVFQTPNAGVRMQVSYKYFGRINGSLDGQPIIPDEACDADDAVTVLCQLTESQDK